MILHFYQFLFVGVVVCAPLSWSTGQNPNGKVGLEGFRTAICTRKVFHIKCDISASAGNLLIFLSGYAAYRLLYKQTRTRCSNSASRAIAMLEKTAKIFPNVCAGISLSNECGHVENSYVFINVRIWGRSCVQKFNSVILLVYRFI